MILHMYSFSYKKQQITYYSSIQFYEIYSFLIDYIVFTNGYKARS